MDVLDDILDTLDLKAALYYRTDFSPPWAATMATLEGAARFHLVLQGTCHISFPTGESVELSAGDLILVPRGLEHDMADRAGRKAVPIERVMAESGYAGGPLFSVGDGEQGVSTQMICGHFTFRRGADHPLLRALPDFIVLTAEGRKEQFWLDEILRLLTMRMSSQTDGSNATPTRLSEVFFIEMLRLGIGQSPAMEAVLRAFADRQIGNALQIIHQSAGEPWTVEALASEVGMSRSSFAERFSELLEVGPMHYLADWRLQKALSLIEDTHCSVQHAATATGYRSSAAFTRAFTARFGFSPKEAKRKAN